MILGPLYRKEVYLTYIFGGCNSKMKRLDLFGLQEGLSQHGRKVGKE
jgi:hypothetical protein